MENTRSTSPMVDCKATIIDFEGPDYSFKSTIAVIVVGLLKKIYPEAKVYLFNSITYGAEESIFVRNYVNGVYGDPSEFTGKIPAYFYCMNRFDTVMKNKEIFEDPNAIIVTDRWTLSNIIYQANDIEDYNIITNMEHNEFGIPLPNLVVLLRQSYDKALELMKARTDKLDKIESNTDYLSKVYDYHYSEKFYMIHEYSKDYAKIPGRSMLLLVDSLSCFDENREVTDYFNSYVMDIIKRIIDESREDK